MDFEEFARAAGRAVRTAAYLADRPAMGEARAMRRRRGFVVAISGMAVLVVAVGVLMTVPNGSGSLATPQATTTTTEPTSSLEGSEAEEIVALLTAVDGGADEHALLEEAIAACMLQQGFEYTPLPAPTQTMPFYGVGVAAPVEVRREFMETYGYGVTTLYWELELEAARGRGVDSNPNELRMSTMSEAEREAFQAALYGPVVSTDTGTEGGGGVVRDKTDSCQTQADAATSGFDRDRLPAEVSDALAETMERVYADPAVTAADDDWFACMADAGYEVERPAILEGARMGPMFPTGEQLVLSLGDSLNQSAEWRTLEVTYGDGTTEAVEYPVYDEAALAQAQETELSIARADLECDEETKRSETIISVRDALYEEVVQDNLNVFLDAVAG